MPVYEFSCEKCETVFEAAFSMDECPGYLDCHYCTGIAKKILSIHYPKTDTPTWINDQLRDVLQKEGEPPIETRKQHDEYLKRNKIIQVG